MTYEKAIEIIRTLGTVETKTYIAYSPNLICEAIQLAIKALELIIKLKSECEHNIDVSNSAIERLQGRSDFQEGYYAGQRRFDIDLLDIINQSENKTIDNTNRCICCDEIIPEGRQVCLKCERDKQ